jgi:hypothetical protein
MRTPRYECALLPDPRAKWKRAAVTTDGRLSEGELNDKRPGHPRRGGVTGARSRRERVSGKRGVQAASGGRSGSVCTPIPVFDTAISTFCGLRATLSTRH